MNALAEQVTVPVGDWQVGLARWAGAGSPLFALHGFTGSGLDFAPVAPLLSRSVWAPDLPGHGATRGPDDARGRSVADTVQLLLSLLDALELCAPALMGYSLGGRLALNLALTAPRRFSALILVGATPGIHDDVERASRADEDHELADRIERDGIERFQAEWEQRPIIQSQTQIDPAHREAMHRRRLGNRPSGLAGSLRSTGTGAMPPRWDDLPELDLPVLLVTGSHDAKFSAIAASMSKQLPRAERVVIPGTGHCAHLERPVETALSVERFLREAAS